MDHLGLIAAYPLPELHELAVRHLLVRPRLAQLLLLPLTLLLVASVDERFRFRLLKSYGSGANF
jgi:hypothetical protein